jgi:hypothetical protein
MTDSDKRVPEFPPLEADRTDAVTLGAHMRWGMELLKILPEDTRIIMSSDPEGNSFHTLYEGGVQFATVDGREIDIYDLDDLEDDEDPPGELTVVLWP